METIRNPENEMEGSDFWRDKDNESDGKERETERYEVVTGDEGS